MPSTNKLPAYIIAPVEAMQLPLPFDGYKKPQDQWADPNVPEYYSLAEIDGTDLIGHMVKIKKSRDKKWFAYSDSNFSFMKGHFQALIDMGAKYGMPVYILTSQFEIRAEFSNSAGVDQITLWGEDGRAT